MALRGGRRLLNEQRPIVAFEFGRKDAAIPEGYDADDFFSLFQEIDYVVLDLYGCSLAVKSSICLGMRGKCSIMW